MANLQRISKFVEETGGIGAAVQEVARLRDAELAGGEVKRMVAVADVKGLERLLQDPSWRVRVHAVRGLGDIGDARTIAPLIQSLMDRHEKVRVAANRALRRLGAHYEKIAGFS
jgi:HEAT repeat protein